MDLIASFVTNHHIIVIINKYTNSRLSINLCLPQGSLLLSIFYLFQNSDLLENSIVKRVRAQDFIGNITKPSLPQANLLKVILINKLRVITKYIRTRRLNMDQNLAFQTINLST